MNNNGVLAAGVAGKATTFARGSIVAGRCAGQCGGYADEFAANILGKCNAAILIA